MTDIQFTLVKEGSLPPLSDLEYWGRLAEACDQLGLNAGNSGSRTLLDAHRIKSFNTAPQDFSHLGAKTPWVGKIED